MSFDERHPVLWQPSPERIANSRLAAFMQRPVVAAGVAACRASESRAPQNHCADYAALHRWSCEQRADFWAAAADFLGVEFDTCASATLENADDFLHVRWFPGATLNYAEHLLRCKGDDAAIIAVREGGERQVISWHQLRARVGNLAQFFRQQGVQPGDRVAAIMPNVAETVVVMLAASAVGAVWSSCSPDFGVSGILDRFAQIEPRWLLVADGYVYNGKRLSSVALAEQVAAALPSLQGVLWSRIVGEDATPSFACPCFDLDALLHATNDAELTFTSLPFDHPLVIAYSSGTTGLPKAIVHRAGGVLLQHLKEHQLHVDLRAGDRFFYFTTCGWMMWNWLVSGLATGACLVLYDGSPFADGGHVLLDLIESEAIRVFGVGAKYLQSLQKQGIQPNVGRDLSSLSTVLSTGSPLNDDSFDFVYAHFGRDIQLSSISGGTDLLSCFVGGVPILPVRRGLIQAAGLGMDVQVWNASGERCFGERGELVCTQPFPTVPLQFWQDDDAKRFTKSYFSQFPGVWCQSDFAEQFADGSFCIHGRSDTVLNPGGVRIGTAEIYRQVEKIASVLDAIAIGQPWQDDVRVVLFVVMAEGEVLSTEIEQQIRDQIRAGATPRHVPAVIVEVADIPRTLSGKIAEKAVLAAVMGEDVTNKDALANPSALDQFRRITRLST